MNNNVITSSFYIPAMSSSTTEDFIKKVFLQQGVGIVNRVDFVLLKDPLESLRRSAFIHMAFMDKFQPIARKIYESVTLKGESYRFYPYTKGEYWILLKNKNPVIETHLNIHQLAENARLLEERVLAQETLILSQTEIIQQQQKMIDKQIEQISRIQDTVYHIVRKVYDHQTESDAIYFNVNYMTYGKHCSTRWLQSESDDGEPFHSFIEKEEGEVSETDSMPTLISMMSHSSSEDKEDFYYDDEERFAKNCDSEEEDFKTWKELDARENAQAYERMRFSADFCDNE